MAQGGVAAVMNQENDDISLHMEDTLSPADIRMTAKTCEFFEQGPIDVKNLISTVWIL